MDRERDWWKELWVKYFDCYLFACMRVRKARDGISCEILPLPFLVDTMIDEQSLTQVTCCSYSSSSWHSKRFRESRLVFLLVLHLRSTVLLFRSFLFLAGCLGVVAYVVVFDNSWAVVGKLVVMLGVLGVGLASFGHATGEDFLAFGGVLAGWRGGGALRGGGCGGVISGWMFC